MAGDFLSYPMGPDLLCKSIYSETLLMLYSATQFVFKGIRSVLRFLETVSPAAIAVIRHVELPSEFYNKPKVALNPRNKDAIDRALKEVYSRFEKDSKSLQVLYMQDFLVLDLRR